MSGCYDDNDYCGDYSYNSWDDCYQPRHCKPRHRRHYNDCWDYSPSYCS